MKREIAMERREGLNDAETDRVRQRKTGKESMMNRWELRRGRKGVREGGKGWEKGVKVGMDT